MNKDILSYKQSLDFPNNDKNLLHSQKGVGKVLFFSLLGGLFPITTSNHFLSFEKKGILEMWPDNEQAAGFSHQFIPLTTLQNISIRKFSRLFSHMAIVTMTDKNNQTIRYAVWVSDGDYPSTDGNLETVTEIISHYHSTIQDSNQ